MKKIFKIVMTKETESVKRSDIAHFFNFKNAQAQWLELERNRRYRVEQDRYGDDAGEYNYETDAHYITYTIEEVEVQDGS